MNWVVAVILQKSLLGGELGPLSNLLKKQVQLICPLHIATNSSTAVWFVTGDGLHSTPHLLCCVVEASTPNFLLYFSLASQVFALIFCCISLTSSLLPLLKALFLSFKMTLMSFVWANS